VEEQRIWIITLVILLLVMLTAGVIIIRLFLRLRSRTRSLFYVNKELARSKPVVAEPVATEIAVGTDDEDDRLSNLYEMILLKMEQKKPYLDPNFSLQVLSHMLNRSERYVSQAINKMGKTNFNRMVVRYRINEARRLITVHGEGITMNEVGEQSGFANRISFYRSFREETGLSPTEFLTLSLRNEDSEPEAAAE